MGFENPLLRGMYPDPSICVHEGRYYLVTSTFEYLPAVPIFCSRDLVHWRQIGNALTRPEQLDLAGVEDSGGVFAPTLRVHDGRFHLITTCARGRGSFCNFFVTAEDPAGPWSDPVYVDVEGIDPSLYWEDGRTYVQYAGRGEIFQTEIDGATGAILDGPRLITRGCGGRDAEGPHLFKRDGWYYLMLAEGGTREGHMVTLMRSRNLWGPFEPSPYGCVLSNRELPREPIQCTGHADLAYAPDGSPWLVALGVRQVRHQSIMGRETCLVPAAWTDDGWLIARDQRIEAHYDEVPGAGVEGATADDAAGEGAAQADGGAGDVFESSFVLDIAACAATGEMPARVISPRTMNRACYRFDADGLHLAGNGHGLVDGDAAFWGVRQPEFDIVLEVELRDIALAAPADEAGVVARTADDHHVSLFLSLRDGKVAAVFRRCVGDLVVEDVFPLAEDGGVAAEVDADATPAAAGGAVAEAGTGRGADVLAGPHVLKLCGSRERYEAVLDGVPLGGTLAKHFTAEVARTQNTGVVEGVYLAGTARARVTRFTLDA